MTTMYLEDIIGLHEKPNDASSPSEPSQSKSSTETLFSFIKNYKQDSQSIGLLHDSHNGTTCTTPTNDMGFKVAGHPRHKGATPAPTEKAAHLNKRVAFFYPKGKGNPLK